MGLILVLALAGVIFICLEVILPGMILGAGGIVAIVAAIVLTYSTDDLGGMSFGGRTLIASAIFIGCSALVGLWLKYFDRTALGKKLVLAPGSDGKIDVGDAAEMLGLRGTALTDLRPSGRVKLDGVPKTCDIIAETGFIESGNDIEVVKVDGRRVIVRIVPSI